MSAFEIGEKKSERPRRVEELRVEPSVDAVDRLEDVLSDAVHVEVDVAGCGLAHDRFQVRDEVKRQDWARAANLPRCDQDCIEQDHFQHRFTPLKIGGVFASHFTSARRIGQRRGVRGNESVGAITK